MKDDLFGKISAFKTFSALGDFRSWISFKEYKNQLDLLTDLFSMLGGRDSLQNAITKILVEKLDAIELQVKEALKRALKNNISCNINPKIWDPPFEIAVEVAEFDLLKMFRINPMSDAGRSCYFDTGEGLSSRDMNVFLYNVITRSDIANAEWFQYDNKNDQYTKHLQPKSIATYSFRNNEVVDGIPLSNVVVMNIHNISKYTLLNDWNNDYIDSIKFWDKQTFIISLLGKVFGNLNFRAGLSAEEILLQKQIERIIDRLSNVGSSSEVDDSFFTFDNASYDMMLAEAEIEKVGMYEYDRQVNAHAQVTVEDIVKAFEGLEQKATYHEQKMVFESGINKIMDDMINTNPDVKESDKSQFKMSLLKRLLNEISIAFGMQILSAKIYLLILANLKLMGIDKKYTAEAFIKENLNLVMEIVGTLRDAIVSELMGEIKSMAKGLAAQVAKQMVKDNVVKYAKTLKSLKPMKITLPRLKYSNKNLPALVGEAQNDLPVIEIW